LLNKVNELVETLESASSVLDTAIVDWAQKRRKQPLLRPFLVEIALGDPEKRSDESTGLSFMP
jgi:hypothetical protein